MDGTIPDTISAHVEGDNLVYQWHGNDAEERHEKWALDDAQNYDEVMPA